MAHHCVRAIPFQPAAALMNTQGTKQHKCVYDHRRLDAALTVLGLTRPGSLPLDSISRQAAECQINHRFRHLSRRIHPDKCSHPFAIEVMLSAPQVALSAWGQVP